jgi:adenine-specific DNA-methyltransferase
MSKNRLEGASFNKQEEILKFLKSDCPEIFSEGKIDCKKLKQTLGEEVDDGNERYGLNWAGKSDCFQVIQQQTTATLKPAESESVDFEKTGNLFIEGDNLEVLKVLQRSYYGKVKCIYIDPPYNTGNDFIYNDNFRKTKKQEMADSGDLDERGDLTRADGLSVNRRDSNGHFHSDWLNMMYPRLFLARNLLRQDGVIFVSIDDNEVHNLRMVMNEIFGEENFVANITWRKKNQISSDSGRFGNKIEHILVYSKGEIWMPNKLAIGDAYKNNFSNPNNDSMGLWQTVAITVSKGHRGGGYNYAIITPSGKSIERTWLYPEESFKKLLNGGRIYFGAKGDSVPRRIIYLSEVDGKIVDDLWLDAGTNRDGKLELYDILEGAFFDTPKPVLLIKRILELSTNSGSDDVVLDFFAGSGTTAQAVMEQNAEDGGNRKFICVQLLELCDENSEAYKAGYKTIAEISKERIRRAASAIATASQGREKDESKKIDLGFKVFKLDKSNFKIWSYSAKIPKDEQERELEQKRLLDTLDEFADNLEQGSEEKNILYELILKSGLDLDVPVVEKDFKGERYYDLDGGKLIIYLGEKISKEMGEFFQSQNPDKIICLERAFQNNDELKTNILLQAEQEDVDFKVV